MQIEESEQVKINLGPVVGRVRLSTKLNVALFVSIEDVGSGPKGWEDLAQLIMLIWLEESCGYLMHTWHGTARSHVNPQS